MILCITNIILLLIQLYDSLYTLTFVIGNTGAHSWSEGLRLELPTKSCKFDPPLFRTQAIFSVDKKIKSSIYIKISNFSTLHIQVLTNKMAEILNQKNVNIH